MSDQPNVTLESSSRDPRAAEPPRWKRELVHFSVITGITVLSMVTGVMAQVSLATTGPDSGVSESPYVRLAEYLLLPAVLTAATASGYFWWSRGGMRWVLAVLAAVALASYGELVWRVTR